MLQVLQRVLSSRIEITGVRVSVDGTARLAGLAMSRDASILHKKQPRFECN